MSYTFYDADYDVLETLGRFIGQDSVYYPTLASVYRAHSDAEYVGECLC